MIEKNKNLKESAKDNRIIRLKITEKAKKILDEKNKQQEKILKHMYNGITEEEIEVVYRCFFNLIRI